MLKRKSDQSKQYRTVTSKLDFSEASVQLVKLVDLSDEEVAVPASNFGVSNVDHIFVNVEVNFASTLEFSLQPAGPLRPDHVLHLVLERQQVVPELLWGHLHEPRHLVQGHRGVQLEVGPDGGQHQLLLHLVHEHLQLQPKGLLVECIAVKVDLVIVGRNGGEELGTGEGEAGLKFGQFPPSHLIHLLSVVFLPQGGVQTLVNPLGVEGDAESQQHVHLVRLLVDLVILVALHGEHGLGALHIEQDVGEGPDGVRVAPHHHVGKADVVVGGDLTAWNPRVERLLVQLYVLQDLDCLVEVPQE